MDHLFKNFSGAKITFRGDDAFDLLQRLSSNDISLVKDGLIQSAFLDRRARIISPFYCIKDKHYHLIISSEFKNDTISYIEKMHFSENLNFTIQDIVWTEERYTKTPVTDAGYKLSDWSLDKVYMGIFCEGSSDGSTKGEFERLSYMAKSPGIDNICFKGLMILDGPFDDLISRNKGCYPGQEVVEKIYHNRRPKEMFVCHIGSYLDSELKSPLFFEGRKVGELVSPISDTNSENSVALAFVRNNKFKKGDILKCENGLNVTLI